MVDVERGDSGDAVRPARGEVIGTVIERPSPLHDAHAQRDRLRALAPGITVEVVPGGHDLDLLDPEFVVDRIRATT